MARHVKDSILRRTGTIFSTAPQASIHRKEARTVFGSLLQIASDDEFLAIESGNELDGLKLFQSIRQLMPPIGTYDRIVLDFSGISKITPFEIYRMSNEMAYDSHFRKVEISMVGLRLDPKPENSGL